MFDTLDNIEGYFFKCSAKKGFPWLYDSASVLADHDCSSPSNAAPRRSCRANEAQVSSKENWTPQVAHQITPGRGKGKHRNALNPTVFHDAYKMQQSECNGLVLMSRVKDPEANSGKLIKHRNPCALCGITADTFCLGCKRFLCINKDRSKELVAKYGTEGVEGLSDDLTTNAFGFSQTKINNKGRAFVDSYYGIRSCYHIAHESIIDNELSNKAKASNYFDRAAGAQTGAHTGISQQQHAGASTNTITCGNLVQKVYGINPSAGQN
jgi:hypothetical protein